VGIGCDGRKTVLGLREGATENTTVVSAPLSELIGRGLDFSTPRLQWVAFNSNGEEPRSLDSIGTYPKATPNQRRGLH
jgi:hypothetical protein